MRDAVTPELRDLIEDWGNLNLDDKVERISYLISKVGSDIFLPGAAAKAASQGLKEVKTLVQIAKNFKKTEQVIILEGLAESGGQSGKFAEVVYKTKTAEQFLPPSSGFLKNIQKIAILTKNDVLNIIKPNGKWIGKEGTRSFIRLFEGGQNEAHQVFIKLTKNAKSINNTTYPGKMYILNDGTRIGYRPKSTSGPATIDIKISEYKDSIKIKFLEK